MLYLLKLYRFAASIARSRVQVLVFSVLHIEIAVLVSMVKDEVEIDPTIGFWVNDTISSPLISEFQLLFFCFTSLKWVSLTQWGLGFLIALSWLDFLTNTLIKCVHPHSRSFRPAMTKPLSLLCLSVQWQEVLCAFWTHTVNWGMTILAEVSTFPDSLKDEKMHKSYKTLVYLACRRPMWSSG